jgi:hypothetical protein
VSPAPGVGHQRASYRLHRALAQAALAAGVDAEVPGAVNVARGRTERRCLWKRGPLA